MFVPLQAHDPQWLTKNRASFHSASCVQHHRWNIQTQNLMQILLQPLYITLKKSNGAIAQKSRKGKEHENRKTVRRMPILQQLELRIKPGCNKGNRQTN